MNESIEARLEFPSEGGHRYPGRHEVVDALFHDEGRAVPAVVKKIRIDWKQRLTGKTKGERAFETASAMRTRGLPTPDPLALGVFPEETWFVCRRIEGGEQVRAWFRHRYEANIPPPALALSFEKVVKGLGRLARVLHDRGVFFRDFTDGNILVTVDQGEPRLWLVDLERARILKGPIGTWRRFRDLSRPGLNSAEDRMLFLDSYFHPEETPAMAGLLLSVLRFRIRLWDDLKQALRPWRKGRPAWSSELGYPVGSTATARKPRGAGDV
jgi:tRNA A-37 threonylcarbamoyl transferase component Bud32